MNDENFGKALTKLSSNFILFYFIIYKIDKEYYELKTTQNPRSMDLSHCSKESLILILILEAPKCPKMINSNKNMMIWHIHDFSQERKRRTCI